MIRLNRVNQTGHRSGVLMVRPADILFATGGSADRYVKIMRGESAYGFEVAESPEQIAALIDAWENTMLSGTAAWVEIERTEDFWGVIYVNTRGEVRQ